MAPLVACLDTRPTHSAGSPALPLRSFTSLYCVCWWFAIFATFLVDFVDFFYCIARASESRTYLSCQLQIILRVVSVSFTWHRSASRYQKPAVLTHASHEDTEEAGFYARQRSYSAYMPWQFRPSVRPSVTRVDQSKTVEARITQFSPYSSPIPLVFRV